MSYLALARKYRPQTFSEVLSQNFIISTLQNAISLGRVSHAYLFTGPRGVGKTSTARIFAKALNCISPDGVSPCGKCENCLDITNGTSLDVIEIDGASNRGVDEIRSLREAVKFVPVKSKYKIIIVDEVHMLTEQAFNALLKTLEEPPEYVIFIFATTDQHKIPVTILSRCQRYEFKKISYSEMNSNLESILHTENINYEKDALNYIIRNSDGCMRDALSLLDQVIAYSDGNIKVEDTLYLLGITDNYLSNNLFSAVLKEDVEAIPEIVAQIDEKGIDYKYMAECLIEHTRNMLLIVFTNRILGNDITKHEKEYYDEIKEYADKTRIYAVFQIFQKLAVDLKYSDFARYVFEFAVFKAASLSHIIPVLEYRESNMAVINTPGQKKVNSNTLSSVAKEDKEENKQNIKTERNQSVSMDNESCNKDIKEEKKNSNGIWVRVLNMASLKEQMLHGLLQPAQVVLDTAEHLIIRFPADRQFQYKNIKSGRMRDALEHIVGIVSEQDTRIDVEIEGESQEEKKNNKIEKKSENVTVKNSVSDKQLQKTTVKASQLDNFAVHKLKEEVKDNQFIQAAVRELGSEILNVEKN